MISSTKKSRPFTMGAAEQYFPGSSGTFALIYGRRLGRAKTTSITPVAITLKAYAA